MRMATWCAELAGSMAVVGGASRRVNKGVSLHTPEQFSALIRRVVDEHGVLWDACCTGDLSGTPCVRRLEQAMSLVSARSSRKGFAWNGSRFVLNFVEVPEGGQTWTTGYTEYTGVYLEVGPPKRRTVARQAAQISLLIIIAPGASWTSPRRAT